MTNFYNKRYNAEEFEKYLANKVLEAELELLKREADYIVAQAVTPEEKFIADSKLFNIQMKVLDKKKEYINTIFIINNRNRDSKQANNLYNNYK